MVIEFVRDCFSGKHKKGQIVECSERFAENQIKGGYAKPYVLQIPEKKFQMKQVKKPKKIKRNERYN